MKKLLGILVLSLLTCNISFADSLRVVDGDTIVLNGEKIRFTGIDTPELKRQVGDRIFFAGEATAYAFSTVHGADRSGVRAVTDLFISPALG